jgi:Tfp pilus assembly protein PilX
LADQNEIEVLKTKLEQANSVIRDGRIQAGQQRSMITGLQAQLEVTESRMIDIEGFKSRAIDIQSRISSVQQSLLDKVGVIREDCLLVYRISENLIVRERNAEAARVAFQEAVIATNNRFSSGSPGLTIAEQTRGNILLKDWEHNITLSKEQAQKVTNSLEEAFNAINGELLGMESGGDSETLRKMNVDQISLDLKEKNERDSTDISKTDRLDMTQVEKHLIQPSAQLSALDIIDAQIGDKLPQLARECYFSEASCQAKPSQLVSQFMNKCNRCTESIQRQAPDTF